MYSWALLLSATLWSSVYCFLCPSTTTTGLGSIICEVACARSLNYVLPPSQVVIKDHPASARALYNSTVLFNCSISPQREIINGTVYQPLLAWRFNGSSLSFIEQGEVWYPPHWSVSTQDWSTELMVTSTSAGDDGYYECVVADGVHMVNESAWAAATLTISRRAWLNSPTHTGQGELPSLEINQDFMIVSFGDNTYFDGSCRAPGPNETVYWYKDGVDVTEHMNAITGGLRYEVPASMAYGVYQCFVENSAGSDYVNYRALERKFSNPPSNFSCQAVDRTDDPQKPRLLVSWATPTLLEGGYPDSHRYIVKVNGDCYNVGRVYSVEIPLVKDQGVRCAAYLDTSPGILDVVVGGMAAVSFSTLQQRRFDTVQQLNVTCPSNSGHISVTLPTPEIEGEACLEIIHLWGVCLAGGEVEKVAPLSEDLTNTFYRKILNCSSTEPYALAVGGQPPGAVCLFGGNYKYNSFRRNFVIPPVSCGPRAFPDDSLLTLDCSMRRAAFAWRGQGSVNVTGVCFTPDEQLVTFNHTHLSTGESPVVFNLSVNTICTFAVINQAAAQCVVTAGMATFLPSHVSKTTTLLSTVSMATIPTTPPSRVSMATTPTTPPSAVSMATTPTTPPSRVFMATTTPSSVAIATTLTPPPGNVTVSMATPPSAVSMATTPTTPPSAVSMVTTPTTPPSAVSMVTTPTTPPSAVSMATTPTTPPSAVSMATTPTTPPSAVSELSGGGLVYVWVILSLFIASLLLVAPITVCLMSLNRRYRQEQDKKLSHVLASVVEQQLTHPESPDVDPLAPPFYWGGSNYSIHTVLDSLHASRTMLSQQSPSSLDVKFTYKAESEKTTPTDHVTTPFEHLVELTEEYLQCSDNSSGYGTTHSADCREYYEQRLSDVSEEQDRTHYVTEYYEPDLEGYVHMVPAGPPS